ncbi:hypothetical protein SAMN05444159_6945 [Bradyrhizobium lablabi]|uniref:Uncharacterized protein n=1 Tax=Bradyrhizobium lablabi TaxID=722472 RepID=A0A1M7DVP1_9BRAD|nr:hypothetical protein [Bradyrhizobium lablabi]SHL83526.1 hypothetical protein SAMN05444159_6945 [Bradyrhizobium lablabi]
MLSVASTYGKSRAAAGGLISTVPDSVGRVAEMRKHLRPYWYHAEVGGIVLVTGMGTHRDEGFFRAMAAGVPEVARLAQDEQQLKILELLSDDVRAFLASAKLAPGPYQLDNYHLEEAPDRKLKFNSYGEAPIELPAERTFVFAVTEEHLKLLRHLNARESFNTREWYGFLELMDVKRPYGDMAYYFIDMADALGEPLPPRDADNRPQFTPQQIERYVRLHKEMLFAAQAFWSYAVMR